MSRRFHAILASCMIVLGLASCSQQTDVTSPIRTGDPVPGQFIIQFRPAAFQEKGLNIKSMSKDARIEAVRSVASNMLREVGIGADQLGVAFGTAVQGCVVTLSNEKVALLAKHRDVLRIEPDRYIQLPPFTVMGKPGGGGTTPAAQVTPWGIARVGGKGIPRPGAVAWIVDTGIDFNHPELNVDKASSKTFVPRTSSAADENGHGSHVSGIIAARDNTVGVVGVAPGAELISMRVLDRNGAGQFSYSIQAFDYIATNGVAGDVVNYSVGPTSRYTSQILDDAVASVGAKGISVCLAAGNASDDCVYFSPARLNAPNVYTISAFDVNNVFAAFSNYGTPVDYSEPGVNIYSCYKGGGYATMSGTSMASPHAAGILMCGAIGSTNNVTGDKDATADPIGTR